MASAVLYVDGVQAGSPVAGTSVPTFLWDTTDLTQGVHILTAKATDAAGNTGVIGGSTKLIVDNTGSSPSAVAGGVDVANGDAIVSTTDLSVPGRGPELSISRTYHGLGGQLGLFGFGWMSELDESLSFPGDGSAVYTDASGGYHVFLPNGSGGYLTSLGLYLTLAKNGDGSYTISTRDQSQTNFNASGQLSSVVDRHGNTLTISYTGGLPTTVTDAAGRTLSITITSGHITQISSPGPRVYTYAYDGTGNLTDYTNAIGVVTHYDYDGSHHLLKITGNFISGGGSDQQTNVVTSLTYDTENRLVKLLDPLGYDTNLSYSTVGAASQTTVQRLQGISPATYATTTFLMTTDGMGAVAKVTDALNNATQYQYDTNENVTQVTDPDGRVSTSTYDGNGNVLTRVVDPGSSPHLNLTTTTTYDSANNVLTATNPLGIVTQITYDSPTAGDPVKVIADYVNGGPSNSDTNVTASMTYDSFGEVLTSTDPLGIVTKTTYDTQGDVLSTVANFQSGVTPDFQTNVTTSSTYDALGERVTATNPLGIVTQYTYDNMGRLLKTVANYQSGVNPDQQTNVTTSYGYDALNRQVTATDPLGIVTQTVYDADGRVTQTVLDYVSGGTHDTQTNVVASTQTYDAMGNVLSATDAMGNVTTTTYDLANHPLKTTQKDSSGTVLQNGQVVYDAAGQVIERDILDANSAVLLKLTYGFDSAGRNTTTTLPPAIPGLQGQAGTSTISTTTYDAAGQALEAKTTNAGLPIATFTYEASGRPASVVLGDPSTGSRYYYVYNGHGDVVALTDSSGTVVASYQYDAFGVLTSSSENFPNGWSNPYRFDGADLVRYDGETGLYWMSVRAYDPALGRFISHDPLGRLAAQGIDFAPYVYADNNPVMNVDPSGERACNPNEDGGCNPCKLQSECNPPPPTTGPTNPCPSGPQRNNQCIYYSGPCQGLTFNGCNKFKQERHTQEVQRAKQSLLNLWDTKDHWATIKRNAAGLLAATIGLLATVFFRPNAISMGIAVVANLLVPLAQLVGSIFTPVGGSAPEWVLRLNSAASFFAGLANALQMFASFFAMGWASMEDTAKAVAKKLGQALEVMAFSFFAGGADYYQHTLDVDAIYRFDLQNVWDSATIIAQCKQQGGAQCRICK